MNPKASVLIISHEKPQFVKQAIYSVLAQTMPDWEALLVDSGKLIDEHFFDEFTDHRLLVARSSEPKDLRQRANPAAWVINHYLPVLKGELLFVLCDDDFFYPWAFQAFWDGYEGRVKLPLAMYGSVHLGRSGMSGITEFVGARVSDEDYKAARFDTEVDYLQFCLTHTGLAAYREKHGSELYLEGLEHIRHADGIFMERMAAIQPVERIGCFVGMNRRTPLSCMVG